MARKPKNSRLYYFIATRTAEHPQFAVLVGSYDCQAVLDVQQRLHDLSRSRGEHVEYCCTAAYDDPATIAAAVAKINETP